MEAIQETPEVVRGATDRALSAAVDIYTRWEAERERSPLDRVVAAEFRSRRSLNAGERRWISEAVYGSVRYLRRQTHLLARLGLPPLPDNLIRLWAAAPNAAAPAASTPFLRTPEIAPAEAIQAALAALPGPETPHDYLRVTLSFPDEMAGALERLLGTEAITAAQALNAQALTTLRVNTLQATREQVRAALPEATPTRYAPWGLELPRRVNIYDLPGFRQGWFEVQEEASQLAALLTDARPGQTVVDVGAGAGGKTLALAAMMRNQGRIVALDTFGPRLEELEKRAARASVTCVKTDLLPADEAGRWQPTGRLRRRMVEREQAAGCVLVDAPCTGSGILRRSPDAKWRVADLDAVIALQGLLLTQASALVAPGGLLCYVTCAFEPEQSEGVIEAFLASPEGAEFTVAPAAPRLCAALTRIDGAEPDAARLSALTTGPYLRTWPHRHGLDAFFAACLRRKALAP